VSKHPNKRGDIMEKMHRKIDVIDWYDNRHDAKRAGLKWEGKTIFVIQIWFVNSIGQTTGVPWNVTTTINPITGSV
jgi:hypothetical protein